MEIINLIPQINIKSRTPICWKFLLENFKVIHEYDAIGVHGYLINSEPSIWVLERDTAFGSFWLVKRGLIGIHVDYIEEIEWIVKTLKASYRKRYEVEPEKEKLKPKVKTVYISTPMTGIPNKIIWQNIIYASHFCDSAGKNYITPFDIEDKIKLVHSIEEPTWGEYLIEDLRYLSQCDEILLVSTYGNTDWKKSRGCVTEVAFARGLRLPIKELLEDGRTKRLYNEEW